MRYSDLIEKNLSKNGYGQVFELYDDILKLSSPNSSGDARGYCPFHDNSNSPSAGYNFTTGKWNCFGCKKGGDILSFYMQIENLSKDLAPYKLCIKLGYVQEITNTTVAGLVRDLRSDNANIDFAKDNLGISQGTIDRFYVGYEIASSRITIPIMGELGVWEDIRRYNPSMDPKISHWRTGNGDCRVFPLEVLRNNSEVYLFEGEKDALRAQDIGILNSISFTQGAGTVPSNYQGLFKGKTVKICYDIDKAGATGVAKVIEKLGNVAKTIAIISLPPDGLPANGDFSDWINLGNTKEDFYALEKASKTINSTGPRTNFLVPVEGEKEDGGNNSDKDVSAEITFNEFASSAFHGQRLRFLAHTVGASAGLKAYQSPSSISVSCGRNRPSLCPRCFISTIDQNKMPLNFNIRHSDEVSLQLIKTRIDIRQKVIKELVGIPDQCDSAKFDETERKNVQTLILSQPIELGVMREGVAGFKTAYYSGSPISDNKDYWFTGYSQADPRNQEMVLNIESAEPARNAIEDYVVSDDTYNTIEYFGKKPNRTIEQHFENIFDLVERITGIYGRTEVQMAVFESVFSVLDFWVGQKHIENGWVENLIIGDTRTGKSALVKKMMHLINVGEFISCENVSAAGIIGGIEFIDKVPIPVWGKFPQNDQGLVTMDEFSGIASGNRDILSQMSSMRSSGIAEIHKIQQARTKSRVRAIWITNPKRGQPISSFASGVNAIPSVISNLEDIARFTKAYAVSEDSVTLDTILQDKKLIVNDKISSHFNNLAILTWSLKADNVEFTEDANKYLREAALRISTKYHSSIPLWEKGSGLDKLAKLSVPIAVLCGSFKKVDENFPIQNHVTRSQRERLNEAISGNNKGVEKEECREIDILLVVEKDHCEYAVAQLEANYDSFTMGYNRYSKQEYERDSIVDESDVLEKLMHYEGIPIKALLQYFAANEVLRRENFTELLGKRNDAENIWSMLMANNCIVPSRGGHGKDVLTKTTAFVRLLNRIFADLAEARRKAKVDMENKMLNARENYNNTRVDEIKNETEREGLDNFLEGFKF